MKVVVAGARGGIGRVVTAYLRQAGHEVFEMGPGDVDLRIDIASATAFLERSNPDAVVHLAGSKPPVPADALYGNNTSMTYVLLEAARRSVPKARHLLTSSAAAYGEPPSSYGISKRITESIGRDFKELFGMDVRVARPFNVTSLEGDVTSVIPQFVSRMRAHSEGPFPVRDRQAVRDFIDVSDVARVYERALAAESCPAAFDVGTGQGTTIHRVAELVRDAVRPGLELTDGGSSGLVVVSVADTAAIHGLGVAPQIPAEEAVRRCIRKAIERS